MNILFAWSLTIAIETFIFLWLKPKSLSFIFILVLMNTFTNLSMNLYLEGIPNPSFIQTLWILEGIIFVIETLILFALRISIGKSVLFSFVANTTSFSVGWWVKDLPWTPWLLETISLYLWVPLTIYISVLMFQQFFKHPNDNKNKTR